jgi:hypothetical protein
MPAGQRCRRGAAPGDKSGDFRDPLGEPPAVVAEETDGTPLARDGEIRVAVVVQVGEDDALDGSERGPRVGCGRIWPEAVGGSEEQPRRCRFRPAASEGSTAGEEVEVTVSIHIGERDRAQAGGAGRDGLQEGGRVVRGGMGLGIEAAAGVVAEGLCLARIAIDEGQVLPTVGVLVEPGDSRSGGIEPGGKEGLVEGWIRGRCDVSDRAWQRLRRRTSCWSGNWAEGVPVEGWARVCPKERRPRKDGSRGPARPGTCGRPAIRPRRRGRRRCRRRRSGAGHRRKGSVRRSGRPAIGGWESRHLMVRTRRCGHRCRRCWEEGRGVGRRCAGRWRRLR